MPEEVETWLKRPEESARAFSAFTSYRDSGPDRSLRAAAKAAGKSLRLLADWSAKYEWVSRAEDYDRHLESQKRRAQEKAIVEMAERHAKEAMLMQSRAIQKIQSLTIDNMSALDAARFMDIAIKAERLARGQTTENLGHSGEVKVVRFPAKAKSSEQWEDDNEKESPPSKG